MKKILFLAAMIFTLTACTDDDDVICIKPTAQGTVTDADGNEYGWVRLGNLDWITSNAKNGTPVANLQYTTSWGTLQYMFYSDEREYFNTEYKEDYGNLMSFDDAVKSAPDGWRLPTDEDWKALEKTLGMGALDEKGWRGNGQSYIMVKGDDVTGLNLNYGGAVLYTTTSMAPSYMLSFEKICGYYWTSTIDDSTEESKTAFTRKIMLGQGGVERQSMRVDNRYLSVRWVRDAK